MLDRVGIPEPAKRYADYPHQFSGGMTQRAMIRDGADQHPEALNRRRPTTALDVTVQAADPGPDPRSAEGVRSSVIMITHDLGVGRTRSPTTCW